MIWPTVVDGQAEIRCDRTMVKQLQQDSVSLARFLVPARARAQQKRLMSEQSKSNLDSGAIKASATSHFTIRRVHMVRTYSTYHLEPMCARHLEPTLIIRRIKYGSGNIWSCGKILNRVLRWRVRRLSALKDLPRGYPGSRLMPLAK